MTDNIAVEASIVLHVDKMIADGRSAGDVIKELGDGFEHLRDQASGVDKEIDNGVKSLSEFSKSAKGAKAAVVEYAEGFDELLKAMREFKKEERLAAQGNVVDGSTDGTNRAGLEKLSTETLKEYIAVDDARGQNAVSVARQIVTAREREIRTAEELVAAQKLAKEDAQASRGYSNLSTEADGAIAKRAKESKDYATSLQAQMQAQQRSTVETERAKTAAHSEAIAINRSMDAHNKAAVAVKGHAASLPTLRYALYDVASTAGIAGLALTGLVAATLATAVAFERDFANVERTVGVTGEAADDLYKKFIDLSTEIPVAFGNLAEIGTAAGQLGIAEDRVASFTSTVAMFAATSNVSTDAAATAFGRLDELVEGVDGKYSSLASSILNVGINSVSTEAEIISIATQIAATGAQAGLTADEIIGLSGSLASLGVKPENARGTFLRVFSQINTAVNSGGTALNDFAAISGKTAEDFKTQWGTAGGFTKTFIPLLAGIDSAAGGAENALRELGITSTRDVNAILKLSQNSENLAKNLLLAQAGFTDGSVLTEQFGVIAETTASKLQILGQTFQAMLDAVGGSAGGPLGDLVTMGTDVLKTFTSIIETPVGQAFALVALAATALIGVMLLLASVGMRGAASMIAMRTALNETRAATGSAAAGFTGLTTAILGANAAGKIFKATLITTGIGAVVVAALTAVGWAVAEIGKAMQTSEERAKDYFGSLDGLSTAIRADNVGVFAEKTKTADKAMIDIAVTSDHWVEVLAATAKAQQELEAKTGTTTGTIDTQTLSIGENTNEWLRNTLASNEGFRSLFSDMAALEALSAPTLDLGNGMSVSGFDPFDMEAYTNALISGAPGAGEEYVANFRAGVMAAAKGDGAVEDAAFRFLNTDAILSQAEEVGHEAGMLITAGMADAVQNSGVEGALDSVFGNAEATVEETSAAFRTLMDDMYGTINAQAALASSTASLGEEFITNGAEVAASGSAMQSVIQGIYESSSGGPEAAARMQGLFDALVAGGYASVEQLAPLLGVINQLTNGKGAVAKAFDMSSFVTGADKAREAARKAATSAAKSAGSAAKAAQKEVRTLLDYASDLQKVFSRAFEIRFSADQGLDAINSGWSSIARAVADTNEQIGEYQADMQSLTADKRITEYWLSVAENYGDTLAAGKLRAELGKIDGDLSKTSSELTKAQESNSKTLDGNSDAAIANRAEILGMVSSYEDYIAKLAASGMSQKDLRAKSVQLKQEFIAQATQLGYSGTAVQKYATAFDDVATAISKVPRNITVNGNVNPALQAIAELESKLRSLGGQTYAGPSIGGGSYNDAAVQKAARAGAIQTKIAALMKGASTTPSYGQAIAWANEAGDLSRLLNSGNYFNGGYTGDGGKYEDAGRVHKGEFVFTKEQTAAWGPSTLRSMANLHSVSKSSPTATSTSSQGSSGGMGVGGTQVVELSAFDRQLLADVGNTSIMLDGRVLAASNSNHNTNTSNRGTA